MRNINRVEILQKKVMLEVEKVVRGVDGKNVLLNVYMAGFYKLIVYQ